uniref:Fucolectin tachylectin-4 pentraxin-1 domain-containing protein n=1 Tax=Labrus bergylta TaxID=56723 RepID=A0A3Q3LH04_9LABR
MKYVLLFILLTLLGTCSARNHENVALRGKATQSHRYPHNFGDASSAIDGNRESNFDAGSCTHTVEMENPWWRVDLLDSYIVTSVVITNRGDCCPERLNGAEVHIGNHLQDNGAANPLSHTLTPSSGTSGRYVTIVLPGAKRYLTLCEVEVYGYHAPTGEDLSHTVLF